MTQRRYTSSHCLGGFIVVLGVAFLWAVSAAAVVNPTDKCAASKIKAAGKYSMCLLKEESKALKKGIAPDFSKCDFKLTTKWAKAEEKGGSACPTLGDEIPLAEQVGSDAARIVAGLLGEASIGNGVIDTEYEVLSIKNGPTEAKTISVEAVDGLGDPVSFTAAAEDGSEDCVTVSAAPDSITVEGVGHYCEETITLTSATDITKTLAVNVYDSMVMDVGDGLLIKYVNKYSWKWSDRGTGGTENVTFLHPHPDVTADGWYPLGSLLKNNYCDDSGVNCYYYPGEGPIELKRKPMIVVKAVDPTALDPPLCDAEGCYTMIWSDAGSGGDYDGSVWKAKCNPGYVAIGVVVNMGYSEPSPEAVRCVREDYTIEAQIVNRFYRDVDTGADWFLSAWEIGDPLVPSLAGSKAPLNVGTVMGCGGPGAGWEVDACDDELARLLLTQIPVAERNQPELAKVRLNENGDIVAGDLRYASSVRVPFTLIPNLACGLDADVCKFNVESSPFYRLKRQDSYTEAQSSNQLNNALNSEMHVTYSTGFESTHTTEFSQQVGLEITAGGDAKFLGSGGSWEVKLSTQLGWSTSDSNSYSYGTDLTWDFTVPPFTYAVAAQVQTNFLAFSEHELGPVVYSGGLTGKRTGLTWLQYPPAFP
jgi:hypothetical protein